MFVITRGGLSRRVTQLAGTRSLPYHLWPMTLPIVIILMLLLASAVAMVALKYRLPYTVALVVTGLVLSVIRSSFYPDVDIGIHLTRDLLFVGSRP